ncbi:cadherin-like domain-containing protein [Shewanella gelidimarina]|uniref:Ig-like domain-containing protein n=1 Tax=Shewanella gelidimarina TaxID=56813 RepID=UPI00201062C7|nr:cadherin-like domain-containing protein [Shewanella gelidimarina]MCL1057282.1 cadherin-like domain-containing protein [Shewanella gelidimarina]
MNAQIPCKKLLLASMITMLVACGSDNDNDDTTLPVNNAPVVVADAATVTVSEVVTIDVLANDTDADGDSLSIVSVDNDSAVITDGKINFTAGDTAGELKFSYTIADGTDEATGEVTVTVEAVVIPEPEVLAYVGSAACATCHSGKHESFVKTGHNFKIMKNPGNDAPVFPYTPATTITGAIDLLVDSVPNNVLGAPTSYDEVTYTVGGYGWKMRWLDKDGYIVTGKDVQYNIRNSAGELNIPDNHPGDADVMGDYKATEFNVQYSCGNCHTTGWKRTTDVAGGDSRNPLRQDDLPGMNGTFAEQGVQCESCHGAGSIHVKAPSKDNITKIAVARITEDFLADDMGYGKAVTCAECHTRDGEKDYPSFVSHYNESFPEGSKVGGRIISKGGLSKHHQTGDEMLGVVPEDHGTYKAGDEIGPKSGMACTSCHDSHKSTLNADSADGLHTGAVKECTSCHTGDYKKEFTVGLHEFAAECTDCHMPKLAKSAVTHLAKDGTTKYGDVKSHLFTIDLDPTAKQFTEDGKFQMPWATAQYSCGECHADVAGYVEKLPEGKMHK